MPGIVSQYSEALAQVKGIPIEIPMLAATATMLRVHVGTEMLVPVGTRGVRSRVERAIRNSPADVKARVVMADQSGSIHRRVEAFFEPLAACATKWPEDAFVAFAKRSFYEMAVAAEYGATVVGDDLAELQRFVAIIDPSPFRGEARGTLIDVLRLITSYEAAAAPRLSAVGQQSGETTSAIFDIIEDSEFRAAAQTAGGIGFLADPSVGWRRLRRVLHDFISRPKNKEILTVAQATAQAASPRVAAVSKIFETLATPPPGFSPPLISTFPLDYQIYQSALASVGPECTPPDGALYSIQTETGHSWLGADEVDKLNVSTAEGIAYRIEALGQARGALPGLVRTLSH